jgi:hypothetical protein
MTKEWQQKRKKQPPRININARTNEIKVKET